MTDLVVKIFYTDDADRNLPLPTYETAGAAGMDLRANLAQTLVIEPLARALVSTGLRLEIPQGFEAQIRPRSGLALKHGVTLANAPGTIDSDYRGPLGVILINLGAAAFEVKHGDRIAQIVFAPVVQAAWDLTDTLEETKRGSDGFGSTGQG